MYFEKTSFYTADDNDFKRLYRLKRYGKVYNNINKKEI